MSLFSLQMVLTVIWCITHGLGDGKGVAYFHLYRTVFVPERGGLLGISSPSTCAQEYAFAQSTRAALPRPKSCKEFRRNQINARIWFTPVPSAWFFTPQTGGDSPETETVSWPVFKGPEHLGYVHANPTSHAVIDSLNNGVRTLIAGECPCAILSFTMRVGYVNLEACSNHNDRRESCLPRGKMRTYSLIRCRAYFRSSRGQSLLPNQVSHTSRSSCAPRNTRFSVAVTCTSIVFVRLSTLLPGFVGCEQTFWSLVLSLNQVRGLNSSCRVARLKNVTTELASLGAGDHDRYLYLCGDRGTVFAREYGIFRTVSVILYHHNLDRITCSVPVHMGFSCTVHWESWQRILGVFQRCSRKTSGQVRPCPVPRQPSPL